MMNWIKLFFITLMLLFLFRCSEPFPKGTTYDFLVLALLSQNTNTETTEPIDDETPIEEEPIQDEPVVTNKYIFVTSTPYNGNLGGITGADSICDTEKTSNFSSLPSGTYKAMLVDGTNRRACSTANCSGGTSEHIDWVFQASTTYVRDDDVTVFTTDANGVIDFSNVSLDAPFGTTGSWWTGLNTDWTDGNNCSNWGDGSFANGIYGSNQINSNSICDDSSSDCSFGGTLCNSTYKLVCVQQ